MQRKPTIESLIRIRLSDLRALTEAAKRLHKEGGTDKVIRMQLFYPYGIGEDGLRLDIVYRVRMEAGADLLILKWETPEGESRERVLEMHQT